MKKSAKKILPGLHPARNQVLINLQNQIKATFG
jgi:hypothetical protein